MLRDLEEHYYGIDGQRFGPVDFDVLCDMLQRGRLRPNDYVWIEAEDRWAAVEELEELHPWLPTDGVPSPPSHVPEHEADFGPRGPMDVRDATSRLPYAGFFIRLAAHLLDSLVLLLPFLLWTLASLRLTGFDPAILETQGILFGGPDSLSAGDAAALLRFELVLYGGMAVVEWIYRATMESSAWQATVGKRALGLIVVDGNGYRLSFARATGRHWAKTLSHLPFELGFLVIAFSARKQGLHDLIARSYVLRI